MVIAKNSFYGFHHRDAADLLVICFPAKLAFTVFFKKRLPRFKMVRGIIDQGTIHIKNCGESIRYFQSLFFCLFACFLTENLQVI